MRFVFRNTAGQAGHDDRPTHHLADVDLVLDEDPLAGLRVVGFAVWTHKNGAPGMFVTLPSKPVENGEEPGYFSFLQDVDRGAGRVQFLKEQILLAFSKEYPGLATARGQAAAPRRKAGARR